MTIYFPEPLVIDIWVVSSSLAVTNSAVNILGHLSWCPCGRIFHRRLLLMSKHHWFRIPHIGCSGDVISVLRRAEPGKHCPARVFPMQSRLRTPAFISTPPKAKGFWAEPTRFPFPSSHFVPRWDLIHLIRATLGFAFIEGTPALFWLLALGYYNACDGCGPLLWGWHSGGGDNKQGNE